jgi:hypothetical protein
MNFCQNFYQFINSVTSPQTFCRQGKEPTLTAELRKGFHSSRKRFSLLQNELITSVEGLLVQPLWQYTLTFINFLCQYIK